MFYPIERVRLHIVQPRLKNFSSWDTTVAELESWGKWVAKIAALAYKGEGNFKQGPWCDDNFWLLAVAVTEQKKTWPWRIWGMQRPEICRCRLSFPMKK